MKGSRWRAWGQESIPGKGNNVQRLRGHGELGYYDGSSEEPSTVRP
jgi:hypothetical protein